ncbi:hypothetical protein Q1695_014768 [Nippostrongylus brasiliensis]|nr:hypothetical protein Q1695_014768 [Nippostrongylus brasiliensis]
MVELRYFRFLYTFWKHITSGGLAMTAANYPSFLGIMGKDPIPYNDPAIRALPLVSCMGIGTAAGFAKAVHQVIKKKLIPEKLWNVINKPIATEHDMVLLKDMSFGHGFFYHPHPVTKEEWIIRIVGNGLQVVEMDRENEIITVMLRNGLRPGDDGMAQFEKISASIFETILEK